MKYLAVDIETTGLDDNYCQILEIGAVVETGDGTPVEELPSMQVYLLYDRIQGEPYALNMNADIIERILHHTPGYNYCSPDYAYTTFEGFVYKHFPSGFGKETRITLAGKNVATFDLRFLQKLKHWPGQRFHRRIIDPSIYYCSWETDIELPDTQKCIERAGLEVIGKLHNAITDCRVVIELVRRGPEYVRRLGNVQPDTEKASPESRAHDQGGAGVSRV